MISEIYKGCWRIISSTSLPKMSILMTREQIWQDKFFSASYCSPYRTIIRLFRKALHIYQDWAITGLQKPDSYWACMHPYAFAVVTHVAGNSLSYFSFVFATVTSVTFRPSEPWTLIKSAKSKKRRPCV